MTTALQKFDIGRVFPTQEALLTLCGDTIEGWINAHVGDIVPATDPGKDNLVRSSVIYQAINGISTNLNNFISGETGRINGLIDTAITALQNGDMAELSSAIEDLQTALSGKQGTMTTADVLGLLSGQGQNLLGILVANGVDLGELGRVLGISGVQEAVNSIYEFGNDLTGLKTSLERLQALVNAIDYENLKGDIMKAILDADDDGKVTLFTYKELRNITVLEAAEDDADDDYTLILKKNRPGASLGTDLNKEWYCLTNSAVRLTIVLGTEDVINGDGVYLEYRSTGTDGAPILRILTESQWEAIQDGGDADGAIDNVIISADFDDIVVDDEDPNNIKIPHYTIVRAKYYAGRWIAEVVPFFLNEKPELTSYTVEYMPIFTGSWSSFKVTSLAGTLTLAGKQPDYCGVIHKGWNTSADGLGTHYDLNESIPLANIQGTPTQTLNLYAEYQKYTKTFTVNTSSGFPAYTDGTNAYRTVWMGFVAIPIYNVAAFNDAISGWKERTITIVISFKWLTYGGSSQNSHVYVKCGDDTITESHTGPMNTFEEASEVFTVTLGPRADASENFTLPEIQTASNEGAAVPYIKSIIFG